MHLHECLGWPGPITHRQYEMWQLWLDQQWNKPSRTDHYLMQIAMEVRRPNVKGSKNLKMKDFVIKFTSQDGRVGSKLSKEQATAFSKAKWLSAFGGKTKIREVKVPAPVSSPTDGPSKPVPHSEPPTQS